jgi:amino acid permease
MCLEHVAYYLIIPLVIIILINSFGGVRVYGNAEWFFKWLKIIFLIGFDITMIILNIRGYPGLNGPVGVSILSNGLFPSGFNPNGTLSNISEPKNVIDGALGTFLSVWTGIQLALFLKDVTHLEKAFPWICRSSCCRCHRPYKFFLLYEGRDT